MHLGWWKDEVEPFAAQWETLSRAAGTKKTAFLLGDFNSEADVRGEGYDLVLRSGWQDTYRCLLYTSASRVGGKRVVIGSAHFIFEDEGCTIPAGEQAKFDALDPQYSHLYLAASGVLAGVICIADPLRPEAAQVLRQLQKLGITQTVMMRCV